MSTVTGMAKTKLDESKYQPTQEDVGRLVAALRQYMESCEESGRVMAEKKVDRLEIPNWSSGIKALKHIDNLVRAMRAAAQFGKANPTINQLLAAAESLGEDEGESPSPKPRAQGRQRR